MASVTLGLSTSIKFTTCAFAVRTVCIAATNNVIIYLSNVRTRDMGTF